MQLDQEKLDIIKSPENVIVVSNPGTGKTTTLAHKVLHLLESGVKPEDILCITFTEKAKKEMFDKIWDISESKIKGTDLMKLNIHTFHSFALEYLVDKGLTTGEIAGNNFLRFSILKSFENNKAFNYIKAYILSEMVPKTENAIRYIKSFGITPDKIDASKTETEIENLYKTIKKSTYTLEEMKTFLKYFIEAYKEYELSKKDTIDYSDMLLMFLQKFDGSKYSYVLVDEMQDMNEIEAEIVQKVGRTLFLVGDSKQAIFGFQGGSIKNFEKFMEQCKPYLLGKNRRSCQQVLDYSKHHFLKKTGKKELFRKELECLESEIMGPKPKIISAKLPYKRLVEIINSNPEKSIGIITRTNRQLIDISAHLQRSNIAFSSTSSQSTTKTARTEVIDFLKGLLSDSTEDKIKSIFTIFSPYTLKESFEISKSYAKRKLTGLEKLEELRSYYSLKKSSINELFSRIILPACVPLGSEWFTTASLVMSEMNEYFEFSEMPSYADMFSFLSTTEEKYREKNDKSKIVLTTVHKAKGREFDVVVYLPSSPNTKTGFIDIITKAILASKGIDVSGEIEEEALRVDFVAFTRAKQNLFIIAGDKECKNYFMDGLSEIEVDDSAEEEIEVKMDNRLIQAYSLFLSGKVEEAKTLIENQDMWLVKMIENYFSELSKLSYSLVNTDAYQFLLNSIINLPKDREAADFGIIVHKAIASVLNKEKDANSFEDEVKKAVDNSISATEALKRGFPGLTLESAEESFEPPLKLLISYPDERLSLKGKTDAVFKYNGGYIIVDFKTDKNTEKSSEHKRQLALYKKILSICKNVPESSIKTALVYIALRGGINTGKFDFEVDVAEPGKTAFATFEKHLRMVLGWKEKPADFIKALLEKPEDTLLYKAIAQQLREET